MKIAVPGNLLANSVAYPALALDRGALTEPPIYGGTYLTGLGQAIAVAAQRHGFIVTDRGGTGLTVFNERHPTANHLLNWDNGVWTDVNWVIDNLQRVTSPV